MALFLRSPALRISYLVLKKSLKYLNFGVKIKKIINQPIQKLNIDEKKKESEKFIPNIIMLTVKN